MDIETSLPGPAESRRETGADKVKTGTQEDILGTILLYYILSQIKWQDKDSMNRETSSIHSCIQR